MARERPFLILFIPNGLASTAPLTPGFQINYQPIGSGGGIRQITMGTVDFGATDGPMTDEQLKACKVKIQHIPTVLGAVVPIFNLPGVSDLHIGPDVLADIYLGKISNWNDARIARDNPGVQAALTRHLCRRIVRMAAEPPTSSPITSPRSAKTGPVVRGRERRRVGLGELAPRAMKASPSLFANRRARSDMSN